MPLAVPLREGLQPGIIEEVEPVSGEPPHHMQEINLNHKLAGLLAQHGVPSSGEGDELYIPNGDLHLQARAMPTFQPTNVGLQLDIRLRSRRLLGRRTLLESFSEAGTSIEDAIQKTF